MNIIKMQGLRRFFRSRTTVNKPIFTQAYLLSFGYNDHSVSWCLFPLHCCTPFCCFFRVKNKTNLKRCALIRIARNHQFPVKLSDKFTEVHHFFEKRTEVYFLQITKKGISSKSVIYQNKNHIYLRQNNSEDLANFGG